MEDIAKERAPVKFGTFTGVFTPTLLTILGVVMFIRLPWVVGNAGLMGAWLIMAVAMFITACTGLSLSSIATNTRIGAGGPYAIVQKSLGYEVGGSVGIPLYLTRPLGTAFYIFGFREGWLWIFPSHDPLLVDLAVFSLLFTLAFIGADIAFRVQFLIMGIIGISILSIALSPGVLETDIAISWWGDYPGFPERGFQGINVWMVFAVFFPATTGILAGANMSGDLKDPRRAIPQGTLWAIAVSSVIYFALAWCAARVGTMEELAGNYTISIDRALWPAAVLAGLLGATFSSALAGSVGGPRILMAMAEHRILPYHSWLSRTTPKGEPRNAVLVTCVLTFLALMMRDLNAIAPLLTMFFLITYSTINIVHLIESKLGLISFRPTLRIPNVFPFLGAIGGVVTMFIISPMFGLMAIICVLGIYVWILRLGLVSHGEDVRSSIFVGIAEWAAAKVTELDMSNVRAWKPNLLVPFEDPAEIRGEFRFIGDLCRPEGSVKLLGLATTITVDELQPRVERLGRAFRQQELFANWSVVDSKNFTEGTITSLQSLQSAFFRPNLLFLSTPDSVERHPEYGDIIMQAKRSGVGVLLLALHPKAGLGQNTEVNVWVSSQGPDWQIDQAFRNSNLNLQLLMGYRLFRSWGATLKITCLVTENEDVRPAGAFLAELCDLTRIPRQANQHVLVGNFDELNTIAPLSDLNIFGMKNEPDFGEMQRVVTLTRATCLFVSDSGRESALA